MKSTLPLLLCVAVTGCSTLSREQLSAYDNPQVPESVHARIRSHQKLSLDDIAEMSNHGVRSSQIITYLSYSRTEFNLTDQDIENLRRKGVNGDIITYLREKPDYTGGFFDFM